MALVVLDPSLRNHLGHHYNFNAHVIEAAARAGVGCRIFGHREVERGVAERLKVTPWFSRSIYDTVSVDSIAGDLENFLALNQLIEAELAALPPDAVGPDDTVVLHTLNHNQVKGVLDWLRGRGTGSFRAAHLLLPFDPGLDLAAQTFNTTASLYRFAFRQFAFERASNVVISALTRHQAEQFAALSGAAVRLHPMMFGEQDPPPGFGAAKRDGGPRIGFLGYTKAEKGFLLLPGVVEQVLGAHPQARIYVQASSFGFNEGEARALDALQALARRESRLTLQVGPLDHQGYFNELWGSDMIVLPYDARAYRSLTSGVFADAISAGKTVVVPADSSLAWLLRDVGGGGEEFADFTASSIAAAIGRALADIDGHRARAASAAGRWRANNGPAKTVEFYLRAPVAVS